MEVILREDMDKLGTQGQVVKVADGYARNYLLPKRLAVPATSANKKIVEQEREACLRREAKLQAEAQELADLMGDVSVTIEHKAGEQEQLFGSVTTRNIADALEKLNYNVDHRKIQLADPIKQLGEYDVPVKLHKDVVVNVKVTVAPEGGYPEPKAEKPAEETPELAEAAVEESAEKAETE